MFLAYMIIKSFLDTGPEIRFERQLQYFRDNANKPLLNKQFGYGKKTLMDTFLYPCWYPVRRNDKNGDKRQVNGGRLIICICLLLSGDIHQCPGPMPRNTISKRPTAGAMVCTDHPNAGKQLFSICAAGSGSARGDAERRSGDPTMREEIRQRGTEQARLDLRAPVPVGQSLLEEQESIGSERPNVDYFLAMRGLHLLHLNVRSLLPKITEIRHK